MKSTRALAFAAIWMMMGAAWTAQAQALSNLFFLHHSTGSGLISEGNMRAVIANYNAVNGKSFVFWDHGYNGEGLTDPSGNATGQSYDIPNDNTDPDGLYHLWVSAEENAQYSRNLILDNHQVIAFKSCFPASNIPDIDTLNERKTYYLAMRNVFDLRPDKLFVVMSTPPLHRLATDATACAYARQFANWLKSAEYLAGHTNIVCFDLFNHLAGSDNFLKYEYEISHTGDNSHPNVLANQTVGPIMATFLIASALAYSPGTTDNPPAAPLGVTASDGVYTDRVSVAWSTASGATGYQVWRNTTDNSGSATLLGATTSLSYDDRFAAVETIYYYWVRATNAAGSSSFSLPDAGHVAALAAPQNVAATRGTYSNRVVVSWSAVGDATGYQVWRNTAAISGTAILLADSTGTTCIDYDVVSGTTYYYWVKAINAAHASGFSAMASGYVNAGWRSAVLNDYDGNGASDLAVFDNNTGAWYAISEDGTILLWGMAWGWPGAWPVPGDYDGDGVGDLAVFDNNTGAWYVSTVGGATPVWGEAWGWPGAVPVWGDYDGDGRSDLAVFDNNTGAWYVRTVAGDTLVWGDAWGWPGAVPVPGDYDGDGKSDIAVFDGNTGAWYVRTLAGAIPVWGVAWGWPGAWPVPGDYDGDASSDLAVFDNNNGAWYVRTVAGAMPVWGVAWGWPGAAPVSGDYDGDGLADLAVFDNASGAWYVRTVAGAILNWGTAWGWNGCTVVGGRQ